MDRRKPAQPKEMATRPKEPKGRGRSARTAHQSDDAVISAVKTDSEKLRKYTSSEEDGKCDGRRKTTQSKTPRLRKNESNPEDDTVETHQPPIKPRRKQSVRDTSAKKEKCDGISPEAKDKIEEYTANVIYPLNRSHSTTTERNQRTKPKKVKSLDVDTSKTDDQSSNSKMMEKHTKNKSMDDLCENDQHEAKVASEKKVCGKRKKEEKTNVSNGGQDPEPKERDVKIASSRTQGGLKDVIEKLTMKMKEISGAANKVNNTVDKILKSDQIRTVPILKKIEKMASGSYYEGVKISKPNEFDIMLNIFQDSYRTVKLENLDKDGPYYRLYYEGRTPEAMRKYLDDKGNISATKILTEFRDLVKQIIGMQGMEGVSVQRKDPRSPAVTLIIENEPHNISVDLVLALKIIGRWPEETKNGMNIDDWLGTKVKTDLKRGVFFMVPKNAKTGDKTIDAVTWRISFSNIEKRILTNHGNGKTCCESGGSKKEMCCRKQCLKLLKYLLELLKITGQERKMEKFCSYHAKTALLHHCANHPKDEEWRLEDMEECFNRYVTFFQNCLRMYTLNNFFIPSHNLFSQKFIDKSICDYLCKEIGKQMDSGYSIFYDYLSTRGHI